MKASFLITNNSIKVETEYTKKEQKKQAQKLESKEGLS